MPSLENQKFSKIPFSKFGIGTEEFEGCSFSNCDFKKADLSGLAFRDCRFSECDFTGAKFSGTTLDGAEFEGCKLLGAKFADCSAFLFSANFEKCLLELADFRKMKLKKTRLVECELKDADFT